MVEIEAATSWLALVASLLPYYTKVDGRGQWPVSLDQMLRM